MKTIRITMVVTGQGKIKIKFNENKTLVWYGMV